MHKETSINQYQREPHVDSCDYHSHFRQNINPMDIPRHYHEKYPANGPHYTSYPTPLHFTSDFAPPTLQEQWHHTNQSHPTHPQTGLSIYTHIPFCKTRCLYCGCDTTINPSPQQQSQYMNALKREVDHVFTIIDPTRPVHQLACGGGTPTHLPIDQLDGYIRYLFQKLSFDENAELSIEVDPRSVDEMILDRLLTLGFNRLSFGVQDLDPVVQKGVNRVLDYSRLEYLVSHVRRRGLEAINLDLIYGLPAQTPTTFATTLEKIITLRPLRLSLFQYAHVPQVHPHQKKLEHHSIPNPQQRLQLFGTAFALLIQAGYAHIGMNHFALAHDQWEPPLNNRDLTRNFMGYTTRRSLDIIGFGASAISSVGSTYTQNNKDISLYIENSSECQWQKALLLSPEDTIRREIILDLYSNFVLDIQAIEKKFAISFPHHFAAELQALKSFEEDALLDYHPHQLVVTPLGRFFIRNICMVFDQYLAKENQPSEKYYSITL